MDAAVTALTSKAMRIVEHQFPKSPELLKCKWTAWKTAAESAVGSADHARVRNLAKVMNKKATRKRSAPSANLPMEKGVIQKQRRKQRLAR